MSTRFSEYLEYKDSGEEWLGLIPSSWAAIRIGHLSPVKRGASPRPIDAAKYFDEEGEYVWTRIADVTASDVYLTSCPQRLSELGSSLSVKLEPGELFLSIAATVGKPCITGIKACIHDGFVYFPELRIPNKFLFYVFAAGQAYKGLGKMGTQLNLNTETVGGIKVGVGSYDELVRIVDFLDYETAKIDALIEKQQQLIALLKEKRQAVISHAVTKGLNPDAPMRDSGVEWLGEVPAHWACQPLKYVAELSTEKVFPSGSARYVGMENVQSGDGIFVSTTEQEPEGLSLSFEEDDVLFGKLRPYLAKSWLASFDGICSSEFIVLRTRKVSPRFLNYATLSRGFVSVVDASTYGAKMPRASWDFIGMLKMPVPTFDTSEQIAKFLDCETVKIDALIDTAALMERRLQERRTALISAAVTGKIDVRGWQHPEAKSNPEVA